MRIAFVALLLVVTSCSAKQESPARRVVEVVGTDYAFQVPGDLRAGPTTFHFVNRGITTDSLLKVGKNNGDTDQLIDDAPGLLTAQPGKGSAGRLEVDLLPGREYTLACFFSDSTNAPPHIALGMYSRILVTGSGN